MDGRSRNEAELYGRLLRRLPEMTGEVVDRLVAELPLYGRMPPEELSNDISRVIERNLRVFARTFREGRAPGTEELAAIRDSAAVRAAEGVPLEAVIAAYHLGARVAWDAVVADIGPENLAWVTAAHDHVISYLQAVVPAVAAGYDKARVTG
ncbi:hypothetical protein [Amycolatopsis anabasis]|uniref:hypothetical protein n=1 Tax=Amycolatopsis anabasis TaxID=1840409 RepID=UPI00131D93B5|nr:hypothetical protein [Amycolatopsis anabasis]